MISTSLIRRQRALGCARLCVFGSAAVKVPFVSSPKVLPMLSKRASSSFSDHGRRCQQATLDCALGGTGVGSPTIVWGLSAATSNQGRFSSARWAGLHSTVLGNSVVVRNILVASSDQAATRAALDTSSQRVAQLSALSTVAATSDQGRFFSRTGVYPVYPVNSVNSYFCWLLWLGPSSPSQPDSALFVFGEGPASSGVASRSAGVALRCSSSRRPPLLPTTPFACDELLWGGGLITYSQPRTVASECPWGQASVN